MKKSVTVLTLLALILFSAQANDPVAQGNTNHELGAYIIEKSNSPIIIDARLLPTYEVSYENSNMKVRIAVDNSNRKCAKYIVVSDNLAIQYNCDGKIFGATMVEERYIEDGIPGSRINLDRSEYFKQRVISQTQKTEMEHIKLISVFYPKLIKNYDRVFAIK